jgi:hypothetical protein
MDLNAAVSWSYFLAKCSMSYFSKSICSMTCALGLYGGIADAQQLILSHAALKAGWSQAIFASGFNSGLLATDIGNPLGIAFTDSGKVMVTEGHGHVLLFPNDANNQVAGPQDITATYTYNPCGLARVGSRYFMCRQHNQTVVELNPDGTYLQQIAIATHVTGITPNPSNGHLFITGYDQTWIGDVDPVKKAASIFLTVPAGYLGSDGITTDGVTLYAMVFELINGSRYGGHILGWRVSDKQLVYDSGFINAADGVAVGSGAFAGHLFVNTNFGELFDVDVNSQKITLLASRGTRGDFVTIDPNGTLLVDETDQIVRLIPPSGQTFEAATVTVNPTTIAGGMTAYGTISLSAPAPTNLSVALSSSNSAATAPKQVVVPAGSTSVIFRVLTSPVISNTPCTVTAMLNGRSSSAKLNVRPIGVQAFSITPATTKGGSTVSGTVQLEAASAPGSTVVTFTSSNPTAVPTPSLITIPKASQSVPLTILTNMVVSTTTVTLTATANGVSKTLTLTVTH